MHTPMQSAGRRSLQPLEPDPVTRSPYLAAQALLQAMEPGWEPQAAASALACLAAGDEASLRRALARIQLRSLDRVSPVAERAARALRLAVEQPAPIRAWEQ
jgi:predicted DNA-binding transcriptional regulator YafY